MNSTEKADTLVDNVHGYLIRQGVSAGARIGIGLSGGADSVSLVLALVELNSRWNFTLFGCYLDHGIRPETENDRDRCFVRSLCRRLKIELYTERVDSEVILQRSRMEKRSIEEIAREVRYSFYERAVQQCSLDFIALGHTLDDHAETMVMRFFGGSDAEGLQGIPSRRDRFIRPLYSCSRSEVIDFLSSRGEEWREDPSNSEIRFLRNRIRKELLPVVQDIFPGYRGALSKLSEKMGLIVRLLEQEMKTTLPWKKQGTSIRLNRADYLAAPEAVRLYTLYRLFNACNPGSSRRIPYTFLKPALSYSGTDTHTLLLRGHGCILTRKGSYLFLDRDVVLRRKKGYFIVVEIGKDYPLSDAGNMRVERGNFGDYGNDRIYEKDIHPPLVARSRRPGDAIKLQSGRKSLKKLFCEWKIEEFERTSVPIIEDRAGVVAVLGESFGGENRVRKGRIEEKPEKGGQFLVFRLEKGEVDTIDAG